MQAIGMFVGHAWYRQEAQRQGNLGAGIRGEIRLVEEMQPELSLRDLEGFDRLWVIYEFHLNAQWRPLVRPPIPPQDHDRVGVFASRSPHRPNRIGLSCVRLLDIDASKGILYVDEADLLDRTPILDLKPYLAFADSFPQASLGWVEHQRQDPWVIEIAETFTELSTWIVDHAGPDLDHLAHVQLAFRPLDSSRKRVQVLDHDKAVLAFRTWRIHFSFIAEKQILTLESICSGYSSDELNQEADPYQDKELHRNFVFWQQSAF